MAYETHYQKTMFVANPASHQYVVPNRPSFATPATVKHPAGGSLPGKVDSGSHDRVFDPGHHRGPVHRGGSPVKRP